MDEHQQEEKLVEILSTYWEKKKEIEAEAAKRLSDLHDEYSDLLFRTFPVLKAVSDITNELR